MADRIFNIIHWIIEHTTPWTLALRCKGRACGTPLNGWSEDDGWCCTGCRDHHADLDNATD